MSFANVYNWWLLDCSRVILCMHVSTVEALLSILSSIAYCMHVLCKYLLLWFLYCSAYVLSSIQVSIVDSLVSIIWSIGYCIFSHLLPLSVLPMSSVSAFSLWCRFYPYVLSSIHVSIVDFVVSIIWSIGCCILSLVYCFVY